MRPLFFSLIALLVVSSPAFAAHRHHRYHHHHHYRCHHRRMVIAHDMAHGLGYGLKHMLDSIEPHPAGCPRTEFCGCGVSVRVYGHPVRELWLAANWFRFPRTSPHAGAVAVRQHHVFYIEAAYGDGTVLAYDPNSGHHLTRRHRISLSGYTVVDPGGGA